MQCKLCIKLKEATAISVRPDPPNLVLGLNEAGLRKEQHATTLRQYRLVIGIWNESILLRIVLDTATQILNYLFSATCTNLQPGKPPISER